MLQQCDCCDCGYAKQNCDEELWNLDTDMYRNYYMKWIKDKKRPEYSISKEELFVICKVVFGIEIRVCPKVNRGTNYDRCRFLIRKDETISKLKSMVNNSELLLRVAIPPFLCKCLESAGLIIDNFDSSFYKMSEREYYTLNKRYLRHGDFMANF